VVTLNDPTGRRRDVLLGPYRSDESKAENARVVAESLVRVPAGGDIHP